MWRPDAFGIAFSKIATRADVGHCRLHDLRHATASLLMKAGVNPKVIAERLGHAKVAFTMDVYGHVGATMQREAAELLDDLLKPARGAVS